MRYIAVIYIAFMCICGYAQTPGMPKFHAFNERYYFLDTNKFFIANKLPTINDSLKKLAYLAEKESDKEFALQVRLYSCMRAHSEHTPDNNVTEKNLQQLLYEATKDSLHYLEAAILQAMGDFYSNNNQRQSAAIEHYISAYVIYKNFTPEEFPPKQEFIYKLGGIFYRYEDYDNAIKYLQDALRTRQTTNNNIFCSIFNTIGLSYRQMKQYDSAILYFQKSYENAIKLHNRAWEGISQGNIGITYFHQKKYAEAIPLLQKDIETSLATNNIKNGVGSMGILATIYNDEQQYGKAEKILLDALNIIENKPFWPYYPLADELYTQMYRVYAAKKNYRLAYLYADSAMTAKDSLAKRNDALTLSKANEKQNFLEHKLEAEKLQSQVNIGLLEIAKSRIEIIFTCIGIAILLIVILFIARERKRSENLLLNILPEKIAKRLKKEEHPIADYFENASILFIDMAGFTVFSDGRNPKDVVNMLNDIFTLFDNIAEKYGLEKIKTIGDCYMAVSGLPEERADHAEAATKMALEVRAKMKGIKAKDGTPLVFRIGLDCGPVVAGVIGRRKFIYDLWGDTVNTASRMESTGVAGEIHCTDRFKRSIEQSHKFVNRGETEIKGKGMMETWLIVE